MIRTSFTAGLALWMLGANAQLVNGGFEATSVIGEDTIPDDWAVSSGFGAGAVADAHTGSWSLGVWHWYWYGPGIASNGSNAADHYDGMPFTGSPAALSGFFKRDTGELELSQSSNDSGLVTVLLTRWNAALFQRDTVGSGSRAFGEQPAWSPFTIGIGYSLSGAPDTLVVQVLSGIDCFCGSGTNGNCCYLYVDDLALETDNGIRIPLPAPERGTLIPRGEGVFEVRLGPGARCPIGIYLYDGMGRLVAERIVRADRERVAVPVGTGLITYRFTDGATEVGRGKVMAY